MTPSTITYQTIEGDLKTFEELEPIVKQGLNIALLKLKNPNGPHARKIKEIIRN
ncbi:26312_t:CDS:1, partial [Dentiscutata erythropus]